MKKLFIVLFFLTSSFAYSAIKTFTGPGSFSDPTKWSGGTVPGVGDDLLINGTCTFDNAANNFAYGTLNVGSTLAGTLNWPVGGTNTLNVTAVTSSTAASAINMTNGGTLQIRTSWTTTNQTFTSGTGTINWNVTGGASALPAAITTYYNLTINATGQTATLGVNTTINNNLVISAGTFALSTFNFTVTGTTSISGTLNDASNTGTDIFVGAVTLNASSTWTTTSVTTAGRLVFRGGIVHNGTTFSAAIATFNTNSQALSGTGTISFSGAVVVTGVTVTNNGTVTMSSTAAGALSGTGGWTQGASSTLNYRGSTMTITSVNFNTNSNTANYNGTGAQTINNTSYNNLTISGAHTTNSITLNGTINVSGIFTASATFTSGGYVNTGSTINYNGTGAQSIIAFSYNNLTISGARTTNNVTLVNGGTINVSGVYTASATFTSGAYVVTGNTFAYNGTGAQTITAFNYNNLTISGARTTNNVTLASSGTIGIAGTFLASATFTSGAYVNTGSTIDYNGTGAQSIIAFSYNNLTISGAHTTNNITLINGGTINVSGTFTASATFTSGAYVVTGNTFAYNGTGAQTITAFNYNNLTISGARTTNNVTLASSGTIGIAGTFLASATFTSGAFINTSSTIAYNGIGAQTVIAFSYNNLTISGAHTTNNITLINGGTINVSWTFTASATFSSGAYVVTNNTFVYNGAGQSIAIFNYNNLTLNGSGTKTIAAGTIGVAGNFLVAGSAVIDATTNTSTINFNGSLAQAISSISATDFYNISVATGASVSLSNAQRLIGTITLNGTGQFNTSNLLTLVSTATGTGNIAALGTPTNFTGNITMQRYISGAHGYRYIGSAVAGATLAGLTPEIQLDGMTGGTLPTWWCNVYTFNEATSGAFANGWTAATNVTNAMTAGLGFATYFYSTTIPVTLDLTGTPNKGDQTLPVTYNSSANVDDGWNLASNPYPSTIDWDAGAGWTRTNIQGNTYYAWNDAAQNYASYPVGGPGVNSGTRYIASSQGFLVQSNAINPALNTTENVKVANNPTPQFWKTTPVEIAGIRFKLSEDANTFTDETVVRFVEGATENKDDDFDSAKLTSPNADAPYISSLSKDTAALSVNSLDLLTKEISIPIQINGVSANYQLNVELVNYIPYNTCMFLEDLSNGNLIDLKTNSTYSFNCSQSASPVKRFLLHITPPIANIQSENVGCSSLNNGELYISSSNSASLSYTVKDDLGNTIKTANNITSVDTVKGLSIGKYIITSSNSNAYCNSSSDTVFIQQSLPINITPSNSDITCSGSNDGIASVYVTGGTGVYTYQWSNGNTTMSISNLSSGFYFVSVNDDNNCISTASVVILESTYTVIADYSLDEDTLYLPNSTVQFTNNSIGGNDYFWNFGDNNFSSSTHPQHTYLSVGTYSVQLTLNNGNGCSDSIVRKVFVSETPLVIVNDKREEDFYNVQCNNQELIVQWSQTDNKKVSIKLYNNIGVELFSSPMMNSTDLQKIDMSTYAQGMYFVAFLSGNKQHIKKVSYFK